MGLLYTYSIMLMEQIANKIQQHHIGSAKMNEKNIDAH